ncbi:MAG: FAD-binding oxidoreductase [Pseudomonadota bacterium]
MFRALNPLYRNDAPGAFPASWYAETADIPPLRDPLRGNTRADVVIVGAGFTGLTCALELARAGVDVVVIDAHRAGFGASGRNGGQCGSGFNMGQRELARALGRETAADLWSLAEEAKDMVRTFCAARAPEARYMPGVAHGVWRASERRALEEEAEFLEAEYGYKENELLDTHAFQSLVRSPVYQGGILDNGAGHLHPLRYCLALAREAEAAGVRIHERSEAKEIADGRILTPDGTVEADHIVLAGNGYLPALNNRYSARVCPINSFIAATEPLDDPRAIIASDIAVADDRFVVNYFRLSEDNRLLFGGRENYGIGFPKDITTRLRQRMLHLFPQLKDTRIDHVWGGTLGITMTRVPLVAELEPGLWAAGGFSGHGVALTAIAGRALSQAIQGDRARLKTLATLPTPTFPGGARLRAPLLTLAMTWYAARDRFGL